MLSATAQESSAAVPSSGLAFGVDVISNPSGVAEPLLALSSGKVPFILSFISCICSLVHNSIVVLVTEDDPSSETLPPGALHTHSSHPPYTGSPSSSPIARHTLYPFDEMERLSRLRLSAVPPAPTVGSPVVRLETLGSAIPVMVDSATDLATPTLVAAAGARQLFLPIEHPTMQYVARSLRRLGIAELERAAIFTAMSAGSLLGQESYETWVLNTRKAMSGTGRLFPDADDFVVAALLYVCIAHDLDG